MAWEKSKWDNKDFGIICQYMQKQEGDMKQSLQTLQIADIAPHVFK